MANPAQSSVMCNNINLLANLYNFMVKSPKVNHARR